MSSRNRIIHADRDARGPIIAGVESYEVMFTKCAPQGSETAAGWTRYYRATNNPADVTCPKCTAKASA